MQYYVFTRRKILIMASKVKKHAESGMFTLRKRNDIKVSMNEKN